jgi:hypothetical protein
MCCARCDIVSWDFRERPAKALWPRAWGHLGSTMFPGPLSHVVSHDGPRLLEPLGESQSLRSSEPLTKRHNTKVDGHLDVTMQLPKPSRLRMCHEQVVAGLRRRSNTRTTEPTPRPPSCGSPEDTIIPNPVGLPEIELEQRVPGISPEALHKCSSLGCCDLVPRHFRGHRARSQNARTTA